MFSRWVSAQILCALSRLRRLKHQARRLIECKQNMSASEQQDLDILLGHLSASADDDADVELHTPTPKRARVLTREVSMASDGYPAMSCLKDLGSDDDNSASASALDDLGQGLESGKLARALLGDAGAQRDEERAFVLSDGHGRALQSDDLEHMFTPESGNALRLSRNVII
jgi:hypothetical protein